MYDSSIFCFECNEGMPHWQAILVRRERGVNLFSHLKKNGVNIEIRTQKNDAEHDDGKAD
jgi:hypothetical protein